MVDQNSGNAQFVNEIVDRWMNDPSFKDQMKADPQAALRNCGIEPDEKLVAAMSNVDSSSSAEELRERIVKWGGCLGTGV